MTGQERTTPAAGTRGARAPLTPEERRLPLFLVLALFSMVTPQAAVRADQPAAIMAAFLGPLVASLTPVRGTRWQVAALWCLAATSVAWHLLAVAAAEGMWPDWLMFDDEDYSSPPG